VSIVQIADGAAALGAYVAGSDALQLHQYALAPLVELTQGELLGHAEYAYDGRHGVTVDRTLTVRARRSRPTASGKMPDGFRSGAIWRWIDAGTGASAVPSKRKRSTIPRLARRVCRTSA